MSRWEIVCARAVVFAPLLSACARTFGFSATPVSHLETETCSAPDVPPELTEARFLPTVSGNLVLMRATGEARLSAEGGIIAAWSPDGAVVAFSDHGAVSVWRAADGALLDVIRCVPGDLGANETRHLRFELSAARAQRTPQAGTPAKAEP